MTLFFAFGGRFLLSLPLILLSLGVIKLKGLTLYQLIGLFRLIQTLRNSGRFSFNQNKNYSNSSSLSLDEAYKILNLDKNKFDTIVFHTQKTKKGEIYESFINAEKNNIIKNYILPKKFKDKQKIISEQTLSVWLEVLDI